LKGDRRIRWLWAAKTVGNADTGYKKFAALLFLPAVANP
jgi:hypothetical protein